MAVDYKKAARIAMNSGDIYDFMDALGVSPDAQIKDPDYLSAKEKYNKIQKMPDSVTTADVIKFLKESKTMDRKAFTKKIESALDVTDPKQFREAISQRMETHRREALKPIVASVKKSFWGKQ